MQPCEDQFESTPPVEYRNNPFEKLVVVIMIASGTFVSCIVALGAVMRYVFMKDVFGIEELLTMVSFWMYFAGGVYASKVRRQISADILGAYIKHPSTIYVLTLVQRSLTFLICLVYAWLGIKLFAWSFMEGGKTTQWQIPLYVGHAAVTFGLIFMLVYFGRDLFMILRAKPSQYRHGTV